MIDKALKMGHGHRIEGVPECRPHKAPEIMTVKIGETEFVTRVLAVRGPRLIPRPRPAGRP